MWETWALVVTAGALVSLILLGLAMWADFREWRKQEKATQSGQELANRRELEALTDLQSRGVRAHGFDVPQADGDSRDLTMNRPYFWFLSEEENAEWPPKEAA